MTRNNVNRGRGYLCVKTGGEGLVPLFARHGGRFPQFASRRFVSLPSSLRRSAGDAEVKINSEAIKEKMKVDVLGTGRRLEGSS